MSTPEFFQRGPSPLVRLVFFSALSIALMVLDARYHATDLIRTALNLLVFPAQQLALFPVRLANDAGEFFTTQRQLQADNDELRRRLVQSEARAQRSVTLELELAELRQISALPKRPQQTMTLAEILHGGRNPYVAKLVLDRGLGAGVRAGQPVIDAEGVVGQVTSVGPLSAEVTLVTEQNQQVPVRVLRNGLRTLAGGDGVTGTISLPFLPGGADIQTGDTLLTSGIDGVYPEGIPVATVSRIERSANRVFARITCTPLAGIARDRYVLVLTGPPATPPAGRGRP
jgi:rod shape-determining protein MreC